MTIKELFAQEENISLRKLAQAADVSYQMLLKAAKKPIAGEVYDAQAINYDEVEKLLTKHEFDFESIDVNELKREVQSKALKFEDIDMKAQYTIRNSEDVWEVACITSEMICLKTGETLRAMSITTFLHQTPKVVTNENVEE